MEVLTIHGREFVKASRAARDLGYAPDYIGQLCRSGSIRSERVGRSWYVDVDDIQKHKEDKRRSVSSKARASLVKHISLVKKHASDHIYSSRAIPVLSYEKDDTPLVPGLKKKSRSIANVMSQEEGLPDQVNRDEQGEYNHVDHVDHESQDLELHEDQYINDDDTNVIPVHILSTKNAVASNHSITPPRVSVEEESILNNKREERYVPLHTPYRIQAHNRGHGIGETLLIVLAVLGVLASATRIDGVATALRSTVQYSFDIPSLVSKF